MLPNDSLRPHDQTDTNIRRARTSRAWVGPYLVEWKLWTGNFFLRPRYQAVTTEFFDEGPVRWCRFYWMSVGVSISRNFKDRRGPERPSVELWEATKDER